ncbi:hypothetical protein M427DRAFT_504051 [Gonapodya prolifera JEL478]|uniref:Uncharacterized protein n=1 Tax=Gonapodya prolifera (strain JEL478) TaxID=1344416 RepID=A0A139A4S1_GONPJ|nr:hypothetical protein M427DRAFT_504051 [Gonapodya prolifera JEL478]|eukprot:KXS11796.1 hypothetical protein M427DRAFT_504051 [Gonapodya prolifera JEL478]
MPRSSRRPSSWRQGPTTKERLPSSSGTAQQTTSHTNITCATTGTTAAAPKGNAQTTATMFAQRAAAQNTDSYNTTQPTSMTQSPNKETAPSGAPNNVSLAYLKPHQYIFSASKPLHSQTAPPKLSGPATETADVKPYQYSTREQEILNTLDPNLFFLGPTPIDVKRLQELTSDHPNPDYIAYIVQGLAEGFSLGYKGPYEPFELPNLPSSSLQPERSTATLLKKSSPAGNRLATIASHTREHGSLPLGKSQNATPQKSGTSSTCPQPQRGNPPSTLA